MQDGNHTIRFYRDRLPHWEVWRGRYFVTMRLAGSIPPEGTRRIEAIAAELADPSSNESKFDHARRMTFLEMERWLHTTTSVQHFADPTLANEVVRAIEHREVNGTWTMFSFVVMPNHLHLFFRLGNDAMAKGEPLQLKNVLNGFRRWISLQARKILHLDSSPFWQREWFDHWSRSHEHDQAIIEYIRKNPVKAGLVTRVENWPYVR